MASRDTWTRALVLGGLGALMALAGYRVSHVRARALPADVIASAGGEPMHSGSEDVQDPSKYRISALSIFSNVALQVKDNYVDPDRIQAREMLLAALNEIEKEVAEVLVEERPDGKVRIQVPDQERIISVDDVESLWEINLKLRDVFRFFEKHLPNQKDMRAIEYAAINGALSTLDPHSVLLKPEAFAEMKTSTKGEFGGLGIVISVRNSKLTIISPLADTPASRAGLKAMDQITRIGEVSTVSMPIEEAVRLLRGPEGSKITIWVLRRGWPEPRKFGLVRERIKIESVDSELLADGVGYIRIKNFQQNTGQDLEDHLAKLEKKNKAELKGLVLDLRNNPGGLLEQAIRISDKFLSSGDIVTTVGYGNKLREPKRAQWASSDRDLPLAVLVNNGSASASEIVAGALKNQDRALIVGERTFGKGSVQVLYDFADSSALKLTIAQYLTPGNISIQNVGVTPDVQVRPAWVAKNDVRLYYVPDGHREQNLKKHLDPREQVAAEAPPEVLLTHLLERETKADPAAEDPEAAEPPEGEEEAEAAFKEDYAIKLAREILSVGGTPKRSGTLAKARPFLEQRRQEEDGRIAAEVGKLGLEWSAGRPAGPKVAALGEVRAQLAVAGQPGGAAKVKAGEEVELVARVENRGAAPLHRVRGVIESENPAFRGRELLFGALAPGESREWTVKTRTAKDSASRADVVSLGLTADEGPIAVDASLAITTEPIDHPQFAYSHLVDDDERGDGDGKLESGEGADLVVFLSNVGRGAAEKVNLRLKSGAGEKLFLEQGRGELERLGAGETRAVRFRFRLPPKIDGSDLPLELSVFDGGTGEWLQDELTLTAAPAVPATVVKKPIVGGLEARALVRTAPSADAPVFAELPVGAELKGDRRVGEFARVALAEGHGWIKLGAPKAKAAKSPPAAHFHPLRRPPEVVFEGPLAEGGIVDRSQAVLSGKVLARSLTDMYVFVNDEKVLYLSGPPAPAAKPVADEFWVKPNEAAIAMPFQVQLELNEGQNKIVVVGRLDEHVVTYRSLFITRTKVHPAPAVAEAAVPGPPAANFPSE